MTPYDRHRPFFAKLSKRHVLNSHGSSKETWHVVVDLVGSEIEYAPGDSLGVLPQNKEDKVRNILSLLQASGDERVENHKGEFVSLYDFLKKQANISTPTRKLLHEIACSHLDAHSAYMREKFTAGDEEEIKKLISTFDVEELLTRIGKITLSPHHFVKLLSPLLPRLYSIASSQQHVGEEVHLTIARVRYTHEERVRHGVCTHFLCEEVPLSEPLVPVYIQKTKDFRLPDDHVPVIMIGPGTGVAPFRAFMQDRHTKNAPGKNWLFFGERNRDKDFFYEHEWQQHMQHGRLQVSCAFSRDQAHKVYVQDMLWQERSELARWLQDGAHVYVCGDAKNMAKDVDACLHRIVQSELGLNELDAKEYMKKMRQEKRYLRDVY